MKNVILALVWLSLLPTTNVVARQGVYIGTGLGQSFIEGSKVSKVNQWNVTYGKSGTAITGRVNAGYRFSSAFGVEAGYNSFADVTSHDNTITFDVSEKIVDLLWDYVLPICDRKLFVDLGFGLAHKITDYKFNGADYNPSEDKNILLTAMLGVRYALASHLDLSGQYRYWSRRIDGNNSGMKDAIQAVLVGLAYNF